MVVLQGVGSELLGEIIPSNLSKVGGTSKVGRGTVWAGRGAAIGPSSHHIDWRCIIGLRLEQRMVPACVGGLSNPRPKAGVARPHLLWVRRGLTP
jgi:hypothetical protein